jgi:hypothetical protein
VCDGLWRRLWLGFGLRDYWDCFCVCMDWWQGHLLGGSYDFMTEINEKIWAFFSCFIDIYWISIGIGLKICLMSLCLEYPRHRGRASKS